MTMKHNGWRQESWKRCAGALCILSALTFAPALPALTMPVQAAMVQTQTGMQVQSMAWDPAVKTGLNDLVRLYGSSAPSYRQDARPYAIFDFDNTTSIMDVEEQLEIWQLDHLAFAIAPSQMSTILKTGIPADKLDATYGADDGSGRQVSIRDAIFDASRAYASLYKAGLITPNGRTLTAAEQARPDYQEFKAKVRWLYDAIGETMDASVSYPWVTYWFTGMTPQQVYNLALTCDAYYGNPEKGQTWDKGHYMSPADSLSLAGPVRVSFKRGITVTPEMKEVYRTLSQNGIDCWIDSASPVDVVRAAVDYFQIPGVKGIVAMTNKTDAQGRYINAYDYDLHAQTQGEGKAQTIDKVIAPQYGGRGPIFVAMDSQGDFNFCTEYKDTKEVLIINRKRSDDAGLCAAIAVWQKGKGLTLAEVNRQGDALFLLQGRDENSGVFWSTDETRLLGKSQPAYLSDKALAAVDQLNQGKSVGQVLADNTKLKTSYAGYKSR